MTTPQGLQGLKGFVIADPEATATERQGGTADPRHGNVGEVATPYPWENFPGETHGPYGLDNELLGAEFELSGMPAGAVYQDPTADETPVTHAAPWPKGVPQSVRPDEVSERRQESANIHSSNLGGSREMLYIPTLNAQQDSWEQLLETDPGITFPAMVDIPDQVKTGSAGWGSRDRVQSNARQNEYGFDSAHMMRRYATGPIPGNYMWLNAVGRPLVKTIAGPAIVPVGEDSPFYGQIPGQSYDAQGSALLVLPATYEAPPDPSLAATYPGVNAAGFDPETDLW